MVLVASEAGPKEATIAPDNAADFIYISSLQPCTRLCQRRSSGVEYVKCGVDIDRRHDEEFPREEGLDF